MKKIVLTFGLISGGIVSAMLVLNTLLFDEIDFETAEIIGYTSMILAFLLVFFGIRSYRESVGGGSIGFWQAVKIGVLITLVSSVCYVATWEVVYFALAPDYAEHYSAHQLERARLGGATLAELEEKRREMARFRELYRNPLYNAGITFTEIFPVGLVMTLVSAGILRRDRGVAG